MSRKAYTLVLLFVVAGLVSAQEIEVRSQVKQDLQRFSMEQLFNTRIIGSACWSSDGATVAFISNISGRMNIWTVPAAGGWPTQLTLCDERQSELAWSPDGKLIAYVQDYGGDEQWDVYVVSTENGGIVNVTNTRAVSEIKPIWTPDGRSIAFARKPKESSSYEICYRELAQPKLLALTSGTPPNFTNEPVAFSADGKFLVYNQVRNDWKDSNVYIVDMATAKSRNLTTHKIEGVKGEALYLATGISPDGTKVLMTSNAASGYANAALLDVNTGKIDWLTKDQWEIESGNFSPDGRYVTWVANVNANLDVHIRELASGNTQVVPMKKGINKLAGAPTAFSRDGRKLLVYHEGADSPRDVWVYDLGSAKATQITRSLIGGLRGSDFVEPYIIRYPSYGTLTVPALVYVPYNLRKTASSPAVIFPHGGPADQALNGFSRMIQFLVNNGYIVIAPNYRGSTGYGKVFEDENRLDLGGGDMTDVHYAAQYAVNTGYVDPKKLVVLGASYGGYLALMCAAKVPQDNWAACVAYSPVVNWFTQLQTTDPVLRQHLLMTMGDPAKDPEAKKRFEERSPINSTQAIKAPLLIAVGSNDARCPKSEADQIVNAVKSHGGTVEYKIYDNEGHKISKRENQIDLIKRTLEFLEKHAKNRT
ncbi:MAG: S9 family peptidase [Acidobacteriota bacterium]